MNVKLAVNIRERAFEYPRCGAQWPLGDLEEDAATALEGRNELGRTPEEESAISAWWDEHNHALEVARAEKAAEREAVLKKAASAGLPFSEFVRAVGGRVTEQEAESCGYPYCRMQHEVDRRESLLTKRGVTYIAQEAL